MVGDLIFGIRVNRNKADLARKLGKYLQIYLLVMVRIVKVLHMKIFLQECERDSPHVRKKASGPFWVLIPSPFPGTRMLGRSFRGLKGWLTLIL